MDCGDGMDAALDVRALEAAFPHRSQGRARRPLAIDVAVRNGFTQDFPRVSDFLARMYIPLDQLRAAMYEAQKTSYAEAVSAYEKAHPCRIHYWYAGKLDCTASAAD